MPVSLVGDVRLDDFDRDTSNLEALIVQLVGLHLLSHPAQHASRPHSCLLTILVFLNRGSILIHLFLSHVKPSLFWSHVGPFIPVLRNLGVEAALGVDWGELRMKHLMFEVVVF